MIKNKPFKFISFLTPEEIADAQEANILDVAPDEMKWLENPRPEIHDLIRQKHARKLPLHRRKR